MKPDVSPKKKHGFQVWVWVWTQTQTQNPQKTEPQTQTQTLKPPEKRHKTQKPENLRVLKIFYFYKDILMNIFFQIFFKTQIFFDFWIQGFLGLGLELSFFGFLGLDLGLGLVFFWVFGYGLKPRPKPKPKIPKTQSIKPKS